MILEITIVWLRPTGISDLSNILHIYSSIVLYNGSFHFYLNYDGYLKLIEYLMSGRGSISECIFELDVIIEKSCVETSE